ncbi:MAG: ribonuclease HII [Mycoplasmoidaceae bacterium]|nr:MAG: ribonuclease HII [Mycoplasmoidaceae bacterium]
MKNNSAALYKNEQKYYADGVKTIAGIDEVGRGSWAGPLVVGIVIFPKNYCNKEINDSKKLSRVKRDELYKQIKKHAIFSQTIFITADEIDDTNNIKTSTKIAMIKLIKQSKSKADKYLVDGEKLAIDNIDTKEFIKGDEKFQCIAAASIIAKVERDRYMIDLAKIYPRYGFEKHVGYGTELHKKAIDKFGIIPHIHRMTFAPIKSKTTQIK